MPLSDCEVRDPRIRRTRQLLQGALSTLLQSKSFEEISVQDITEAATVNRATFYDHYNDKFALLDALVAGGFHKLLHERDVQFDGTCPSAATAIIRATCDYLTVIRENHPGCDGRTAFEPLIDAAIIGAIRRVLMGPPGQVRPGNTGGGDSPLSQIAASGAAWAIYGTARQWSLTPDRAPADEVVPQILELVLPMLRQSLSSAAPDRSDVGDASLAEAY